MPPSLIITIIISMRMFIFIANLVYFMTIPKLSSNTRPICAKTFVHIYITYLFLIRSYEKNLLINQVDNKLDLSSSLPHSIHPHVRLYLCIIKLFITFSIIIFCLYFARFCEKNNTYQWLWMDGKGETKKKYL